ncbi:cysteine desulfurase [Bathymodiolus japonicus methanotrophic gill symbiont]|uniref:cysteine desulfurase family protein n=1 Tax=Bathymodiolus japonicus methanotrophic gill symbiont TaxID=113269 RepID=UPI001B746A32|nr:cysteine desulfurase family protein [Bathymodiolus japonicus methanotrophic gill symbiont]GFO72046.1 cysteine desulfurase [Bathymodiolus japonicus methanotrophic gill symbiont]
MIYFDHNATTSVDERVLQAMLPFFSRFYANPSSLYKLARLSRSAIDTAREQVAQLVNARAEQVVFTSGGTEANNLALKGCVSNAKIVTAAFEHPSVLQSASAQLVGITSQGYIDQQALTQLEGSFDLASFMLVNNETGVIQDIASLSSIMQERKTLVHTDAVQAAGKIPVDFQVLGVDLMSLSSHKIYGPKGCGALITSAKYVKSPLQTGGGQEAALRAGTENVPAIVGFGKAAELAYAELDQRHQHCLALRVRLEEQLLKLPEITIFAQHSQRLANTVQFGVQGHVGEMLLMQLDQQGVMVSSGSACASTDTSVSHVLMAMGVGEDLAKSAIRISLGQENTAQEVDSFVRILKRTLLKAH